MPVVPGRAAKGLLKTMTKIAWGAEAAELADLGDGLVGFQKHPCGCADPKVQQVGNSGGLKVPLEATSTLPLADGRGVGDLLQSQRLGEILVDKAEHLLDSGNVIIGLAGDGALMLGSKGQQPAPELAELVLQHKFIAEGFLPREFHHFLQIFQHQLLVMIIRTNGLQLNIGAFGDGVDVLLVQLTSQLANEEGNVENMGIENAGILAYLPVAVQYPGADKYCFALFQTKHLIRGVALHGALGYRNNFIAWMPVPGNGSIHMTLHGFQQADVRQLVCFKMGEFQIGGFYLEITQRLSSVSITIYFLFFARPEEYFNPATSTLFLP